MKDTTISTQYHHGPKLSRYTLYTLQSTDPEAFSSSCTNLPASFFRSVSFWASKASVVASSPSTWFSCAADKMFVLLDTREGAALPTGVFASLRRRLFRMESVSSP